MPAVTVILGMAAAVKNNKLNAAHTQFTLCPFNVKQGKCAVQTGTVREVQGPCCRWQAVRLRCVGGAKHSVHGMLSVARRTQVRRQGGGYRRK